MLRPDPGDDFPDVILGVDDLTKGGHRPDDILGSFPYEALLLEGVARAQASGAECDQTEQGIVVAPVDPNLIGERCRHSPATSTAVTSAAIVGLKQFAPPLGDAGEIDVRAFQLASRRAHRALHGRIAFRGRNLTAHKAGCNRTQQNPMEIFRHHDLVRCLLKSQKHPSGRGPEGLFEGAFMYRSLD